MAIFFLVQPTWLIFPALTLSNFLFIFERWIRIMEICNIIVEFERNMLMEKFVITGAEVRNTGKKPSFDKKER